MIKKKLIPKMSWIIFDDDERMKKPSEPLPLPINDIDIFNINKMIAYIDACYNGKYEKYNIKPGIAIAAIQIGYPKKIIYINFDEGEIHHQYLLANAQIIEESLNKSYIDGGEGCLSVKKQYKGLSIRKEKIKVKAYDLINNKEIIIDASGLLSICLQHEIDHTNGILFYDRINVFDPFFIQKEWTKI